MTINDLHLAIANLSTKRNAFWSEADFQFALAWELQRLFPKANIHLERRFAPYYVDIWVENQGKVYPIELKYKTTKTTISQNNGTVMTLKNHGAVDFGCYDYLKDIGRIEDIASREPNFDRGFAVMLTNDHMYYTNTNRTSAYSNFKIYQSAVRTGNLNWGQTQKGTTFACGSRIGFTLKNSYTMQWNPYNNMIDRFQYLINEIK